MLCWFWCFTLFLFCICHTFLRFMFILKHKTQTRWILRTIVEAYLSKDIIVGFQNKPQEYQKHKLRLCLYDWFCFYFWNYFMYKFAKHFAGKLLKIMGIFESRAKSSRWHPLTLSIFARQILKLRSNRRTNWFWICWGNIQPIVSECIWKIQIKSKFLNQSVNLFLHVHRQAHW